MGGGEAMAVIGIGATSRASIEDVLEIIATAKTKMAEREFVSPPHPRPLPPGERGQGVPVAKVCPMSRGISLSPRGRGVGVRGEQHIKTLASLDRPAVNAILAEAAGRAGLDLMLLTLDELQAAAHLCVTHSEKSMEHYGIPSVAEAAALAAAGAGARLLLPRFCGRYTTASVAAVP